MVISDEEKSSLCEYLLKLFPNLIWAIAGWDNSLVPTSGQSIILTSNAIAYCRIYTSPGIYGFYARPNTLIKGLFQHDHKLRIKQFWQ